MMSKRELPVELCGVWLITQQWVMKPAEPRKRDQEGGSKNLENRKETQNTNEFFLDLLFQIL
jgi:hypothetical protein